MAMMPDVDFPLFITLWNQLQGQTTPVVHLRMGAWLSVRTKGGDPRLLLMAFRACGKSTIVGLYAAWRLMCDPNVRILVISADDHLAVRMVRAVRRVIERHPLTAHLRPESPDQWAMDRFTVRRSREMPDSSMTARGLAGNLTGLRADLIICDDVEVPNTCDTSDKRADLRARLSELSYVAAPQAMHLYVGTPHAADTIYATSAPRGHAARPFLRGYKSLKIPVVDKAGIHAWPEKFGPDVLETLRRTTGQNKFDSQMMLRSVRYEDIHLNPEDIQVYDAPLTPVKELSQLYIGQAQMASCSAWWDPAFGTDKGDGSALAIVFTDTKGHIWLHHLSYIKVALGSPHDPATDQCMQVARILKDLYVPVIGVETNGIGRFLPALLRREIVRVRAGTAVVEQSNRAPKSARIQQAFGSVLAARMLHAHIDVMTPRFMDEMRDFSPLRNSGRDDGLDAAAGALLMEPVRLPRESGGGFSRPFWRG